MIYNYMEEFLKEHNIKLEGEIVKLGRKYFLTNKELLKNTKMIPRKPEHIGIFLGIKKKNFNPSPALIELGSKNAINKAIINEKAEWMFLCGKDVFEENVQGIKKGTVYVMNEQNENLGMGFWTKKKGKRIIKYVLDKGVYLRN